MGIPRWRLALTGAALIVLSVAGIGLVTAAAPPPADDPLAAIVNAQADLPLRGGGRYLVHGTITIDRPDDGLVTYQLDGGTISAVDADSISVAEEGGTTVTVAIDDATRVRVNRRQASIADLKTGQRVIVVSRVGDSGAATARLIRVPPAER